jgi:TAG lipase/steryl ester hydrolase/phospholipase A2/LPA acyltransferase
VRAAAQTSTSTLLEMPLIGRPVIRPVMRTLAESLPDFGAMARRNRRLAQLEEEMENAGNYAAWRGAAIAWDTEAGLDEWKTTDASPLYDYKLIQRRLAQILGAREGGYVRRLMFLLQEGLHGNLGNLSNPLLYECTRFGTKRLVERYLDEVCESLEFLCEVDSPEITPGEKREFFESTRQSFGQSCLMLSGGAALGIYHLGVVKSLWENGLLPQVISGSSAGSIVAALLGTHNDAQLRELMEAGEGILELIRYNRPPRPWLFDVDHFNRVLRTRVPEMSFQEGWKHSGREINITVCSEDRHADDRLLNHRTSPNVVIPSAVRASCAAPFLMPPSELTAKTINGETIPYIRGRRFLDGSIGDDLPIRRLTRLYGVNHSIVSMVNPLVLPFASRRSQHGSDAGALTRRYVTRLLKETASFSLEMVQRVLPSENLNYAIDKVRAVMAQEYRGDITLVPPRRLIHVYNLLRNHSREEEREFVRIGMRLTWPDLEMIKNTTAISRTFRSCVARLRTRSRDDRQRPRGTRRRRAAGGRS